MHVPCFGINFFFINPNLVKNSSYIMSYELPSLTRISKTLQLATIVMIINGNVSLGIPHIISIPLNPTMGDTIFSLNGGLFWLTYNIYVIFVLTIILNESLRSGNPIVIEEMKWNSPLIDVMKGHFPFLCYSSSLLSCSLSIHYIASIIFLSGVSS